MTIKERVESTVNGEWNFEEADSPAGINKMIVMAYYMGRESSAREVSDGYRKLIQDQMDRAKSCRYHKMAEEVVGDKKYLYFPDYSGEMTSAFGSDLADI